MKDGDTREESEVAVFSILDAGLAALDLEPPAESTGLLTDLVLLLDLWAPKVNLTGHRNPESMASRLVLDAAALAAEVPELGAARSLADLGTGAGFPGLPIAILFPQLEVYLVDSRKKRNHFQREARRRLQLNHVHPVLGRSDEVDQVKCDCVIAQAMTYPDQALRLMSQWAAPGATLILPASDAATRPQAPEEFGSPELREYHVPGTMVDRRLWILKSNLSEG
jgi:16S rRNA (guanine527-N7)-methyltransferase